MSSKHKKKHGHHHHHHHKESKKQTRSRQDDFEVINGEISVSGLKNSFLQKVAKGDTKAVKSALRGDESLLSESTRDGLTALHLACKFNQTASLVILLKHARRTDINSRSGSGIAPIHFAAALGHSDCIAALLEVDAEVLATVASSNKREDVEAVRKKRKVDVDLRTSGEGYTAVCLAAAAGHKGTVQLLMKAKADPMMENAKGHFPLYYARKRRDWHMCHSLITCGADVSVMYDREWQHRNKETAETDAEDDANHVKVEGKSVDAWGFLLEDDASASTAYCKAEDWNGVPGDAYGGDETVVERRKVKWATMLKSFEENGVWGPKLHSRIAKGVPPQLRAALWRALLCVEGSRMTIDVDYEHLSSLKTSCAQWGEQIDLDVNRESRTHVLFAERYGPGQSALFRILKAFAAYSTDVGYCQGMSSVVALLLLQLGVSKEAEYDAFLALTALFEYRRFLLRDIFLPGFPLLTQIHHVHTHLVSRYFPAIQSVLDKAGFSVEVYGTEWFLKFFYHRLPFSLVMRIWDLFLASGYRLVFQVSLAIFQYFGPSWTSQKLSAESIISALQRLESAPDVDAEKFMNMVIDWEPKVAKGITEAGILWRSEGMVAKHGVFLFDDDMLA